ncbi:uncharacterized protein LOC136078781 [Hydra vulgaris]|uniref:Uncharacterized protein LOC136078781 n=1 Tax=Hydra vulgaris TaxID=6087 RepID=A0ABM4BNI2_HYDVU
MSLSIGNLRGQGYDSGRSMKGKNKGVQRRILDVYPRELFILCCAHTLNLNFNDAVKCCLEATAFIDLMQRVCVFFSASTRRWEVLTRHVSNLTVKLLSKTRWESQIDALKPLHYQLGDIYDALAKLANDTNITGASGNSTQVVARFIAKAISSFNLKILALFEPESTRIRRMNKQFTYEGDDKPIQNLKEKFLINFYFAILDTEIRSEIRRYD